MKKLGKINILKISMSNNNQQFSKPANFTLYKNDDEIMVDFLYFPKFGPNEGNSLVTFSCKNFFKFLYRLDLIPNIVSCK